MRHLFLGYLCVVLLAFSVVAQAQDQEAIQATRPGHKELAHKPFGLAPTDSVTIPNLAATITLDGKLDESVWQQANTLTLDFVTRPYNNTASPVKTIVRLFEDGETLFVAFEAYDPNPHAIRAFYRDRDRIWSDDLVGIKLDTFNTQRLAYQFFANPLGVQADSIQNEMTGGESDSWNAIWQSHGAINDNGYIVEFAIPLRTMNFVEQDGDKIWGAEFVRFYPRNERLRMANIPWDRDNACDLCQLSKVEGFSDATQGNNLAWVPTLVLGAGRSRDGLATTQWDYHNTAEVGMDVKWGITPQMSLQATLNPDFSQVEADTARVSINNTFSLYFSERRPFFVENADYFSSNQNLVYTRNIVEPDFGAKLTGQHGAHSVGVFVANDNITRFVVPGNLSSDVAELAEETTNGALRYRYDASNDLSVGWVSTLRQAGDYRNLLNGIDVKYRLTQKDTLRAQYVYTDTQYPTTLFKDFCDNDCTTASDYSEVATRTQKADLHDRSWRLRYRHEEKDWYMWANRFENGKDFRADLGFETRADWNKSELGGGYYWWNSNSWWNRIRINGDWDITHNDQGELLEREVEAYASIRGTWQSFLEIGHLRRDRVGLRQDNTNLAITGNSTRFQESSSSVYMETRPNPLVFFSTFIRAGDQINFTNNRLGEQLFVESRLDMNIGQHAQVRFRQVYSDLNAAEEALFTARISDVRVTYQFDARQYLRLIVLYSNIDRNARNYIEEVAPLTRKLGAQLLYSYKVNPLTKFFVGVASAGIEETPLTAMRAEEESVFMKFSYAYLQ